MLEIVTSGKKIYKERIANTRYQRLSTGYCYFLFESSSIQGLVIHFLNCFWFNASNLSSIT